MAPQRVRVRVQPRQEEGATEASVTRLHFPMRHFQVYYEKFGSASLLSGSFWYHFNDSSHLSKFSVLQIPQVNQHNIRYIFSS